MDKYVWASDHIPTIDVHSIKKHEVLREYLLQYIHILGDTIIHVDHLDITFVDGFSGGGLYQRRDGTLHEGSPLVFLRAAEEAEIAIQQKKKFSLNAHYVFLDEKKSCVHFLKNTLSERGYGSRLEKDIFLQCGRFDDNIENIITHIKARGGTANKCIFLLDQYGWSDVTIALLKTIFRYLRKPEVILTFAVDAMIDYMSTAPMYIKAIEQLGFDFHTTQDLLLEKSQRGWRTIVQYKLYKELIKNINIQGLFHTNFFIKSSESSRSYWLLHLSTHRRARNEMMLLHWRFKNHFIHEGKSGFNMLMYEPRNDEEYLMQSSFCFDDDAKVLNEKALLNDIPRIISTNQYKEMSVEDLIISECNDTTATFDDIFDSIKFQYENGGIVVRKEDGKEKPKNSKIKMNDIISIPSQIRLFTFDKNTGRSIKTY